jgi:hypothetical protein
MVKLCRLAVIALAVLFSSTAAPSAYAQSQVSGTLGLVRSSGSCDWYQEISTSSRISSVVGLWFLNDSKDTTVSRRGIETLGGSGRTIPNNFTSKVSIIPGTSLGYHTSYTLANWDRGSKTVTVLKRSWIYRGWAESTQIYCYAAWAGTVKYR